MRASDPAQSLWQKSRSWFWKALLLSSASLQPSSHKPICSSNARPGSHLKQCEEPPNKSSILASPLEIAAVFIPLQSVSLLYLRGHRKSDDTGMLYISTFSFRKSLTPHLRKDLLWRTHAAYGKARPGTAEVAVKGAEINAKSSTHLFQPEKWELDILQVDLGVYSVQAHEKG